MHTLTLQPLRTFSRPRGTKADMKTRTHRLFSYCDSSVYLLVLPASVDEVLFQKLSAPAENTVPAIQSPSALRPCPRYCCKFEACEKQRTAFDPSIEELVAASRPSMRACSSNVAQQTVALLPSCAGPLA